MFSAHFLHTPSPSPPSSPPCIDSSPVSSRASTPVVANDYDMDGVPDHVRTALPSHVVDPFAASVSDWVPPEYERRSSGSAKTGKRARAQRDTLRTPPRSVKKMRYSYRVNRHSASSESIFALGKIDLRMNDMGNNINISDKSSRDEQIWEDASTRVFNGNGNIDLSNQNLAYIPRKFIEDMENMYIPPDSLNSFRPPEVSIFPGSASRPFVRSLTAPADIEEPGSYHFPSNARRMAREGVGRVRTIADISLGLPKGEIALYLMANQITKLPRELFSLQKLTILSIRHNKLTYLPPEIKHLDSLHTLNVAYNQLRYLPCEMLQMSLSTLTVHPNPFLEPAASMQEAPFTGRIVSQPVHPLPRIIPLVEVCLRKLLSPTLNKKGDTILATHYDLPLQEFQPLDTDLPPLPGKKRVNKALPSHLRKVLDACLPGSVYDDEEGIHNDEEYLTGLGCCPLSLNSKERDNCGVFVLHAEERYTWETKVANVEIGARVPVRWRGCNWGCLNFLGEAVERTREDSFDEAVHVMDLDSGTELGFDE